MKTLSLLLFTAVLMPVATVQARVQRTVEKTFTVQPGGMLTVATQGGDIQVKPGSGNEVRVQANQTFHRADDEAEADAIARDLVLEIAQSGNDVSASAKYTRKSTGKLWGSWPPVSVSFVVTVPEQYHVTLNTSGGNVVVGDLRGMAKVQTSGGDLRLGQIRGEVDGTTSGGNIRLAQGDERVKLRTSGGNIRVERATGKVELNTSGGDIVVDEVSGSLNASTSGGNVRATFSGPLADDVSLSTSGGTVVARVNADTAFRLDASTSGGGVRAEGLTIRIEKGGTGRSRLAGEVNGGGPTLRMRSSGGDVTVEAR